MKLKTPISKRKICSHLNFLRKKEKFIHLELREFCLTKFFKLKRV